MLSAEHTFRDHPLSPEDARLDQNADQVLVHTGHPYAGALDMIFDWALGTRLWFAPVK
jgi:hypothetical protein